MRYQLAVIAHDPDEAVRVAGGWMFDQVMAGWHVTVLTSGPTDHRPLRILGVGTHDLESSLTRSVHDPWPDTVAVAWDLYHRDNRIQDGVHHILNQGLADLILWGAADPAAPGPTVDRLEHRLSSAAHAFKTRALAALGDSEPAAPTETFQGTGSSWNNQTYRVIHGHDDIGRA